jgi:hypothetical protein
MYACGASMRITASSGIPLNSSDTRSLASSGLTKTCVFRSRPISSVISPSRASFALSVNEAGVSLLIRSVHVRFSFAAFSSPAGAASEPARAPLSSLRAGCGCCAKTGAVRKTANAAADRGNPHREI